MGSRSSKRGGPTPDTATDNFERGRELLRQHPLFAPLLSHAFLHRKEGNRCPEDGWAVVAMDGTIHVHPKRRAEPEEWAYVLAHALLHLGFGHFQEGKRLREWNTACDLFIARFLATLRLGRHPKAPMVLPEIGAQTEEALYRDLCERGIPPTMQGLGVAGHASDMLYEHERWRRDTDWQKHFAEGLAEAVTNVVQVAAGLKPSLGSRKESLTPARRARDWFINTYPLLGALTASFEIVEDPLVCIRLGISVAAVDPFTKEVFINPAAGLDEQECRFVMAHELLHVGLRHDVRRQGRDPYLWNVACDYIINGWLVEMQLGQLPETGLLHDPQLKGLSAEGIYDRIVTDMRTYRKLATLRGIGLGDILERGTPDWWTRRDGVALDEFYRRCLGQGLVYHLEQARGLLPSDLVEEIRALEQPPIPWDVELARWFDHHFPPLEKVRSYARPSRRQMATPEIPRPRYTTPEELLKARTFGVVLDTSGSMDRALLAKALGTIASYALARDVQAVRVIYCDAAPYDQGYMPAEDILGHVKVRGRGGTVLQPAIDLLEGAKDFPEKGPILVITDGYCDRLHIRREHAFVVPAGNHLPFVPKGPIFRVSGK